MLKRVKNQKGFTLIELIVVIAILGILALIAIPRLAGFTKSAKVSADRSTAAVIGKAAETYAAGANMTDAQKVTFGGDHTNNISTLVTQGLLKDSDTAPQSSTSAFSLNYDSTQGIFTVSLDGTQFYPVAGH